MNRCETCEHQETCELANQVCFCEDCKFCDECPIKGGMCGSCDAGFDIECNNGFEDNCESEFDDDENDYDYFENMDNALPEGFDENEEDIRDGF